VFRLEKDGEECERGLESDAREGVTDRDAAALCSLLSLVADSSRLPAND
jgi:hypothetical protein